MKLTTIWQIFQKVLETLCEVTTDVQFCRRVAIAVSL
jgi:hypothetical protein